MNLPERKGKRIRLELPVEFQVLAEDNSVTHEGSGLLHDLSPGGCAFYHDREIAVGERLRVRIQLNEELAEKFQKPMLTARGAVVRAVHEGEGYLLSMRFLPSKSNV